MRIEPPPPRAPKLQADHDAERDCEERMDHVGPTALWWAVAPDIATSTDRVGRDVDSVAG